MVKLNLVFIFISSLAIANTHEWACQIHCLLKDGSEVRIGGAADGKGEALQDVKNKCLKLGQIIEKSSSEEKNCYPTLADTSQYKPSVNPVMPTPIPVKPSSISK
jgi:hypothetical protein